MAFDLDTWLREMGMPLADPYHAMLMRFSHEELEALVAAAQLVQREQDAQRLDILANQINDHVEAHKKWSFEQERWSAYLHVAGELRDMAAAIRGQAGEKKA